MARGTGRGGRPEESRGFVPRTRWWEEPLALFADDSIDSSRMLTVSEGIRESGMALIRVLDDYPYNVGLEHLVEGLVLHLGDPGREERLKRSVRDLNSAGLLSCSGLVTPTAAARKFDCILRAAHELRHPRR